MDTKILPKIDKEYLGRLLAEMSNEVRAFAIDVLNNHRFWSDRDLEQRARELEIDLPGYSRENFKCHLKGQLSSFVISKKIPPDERNARTREGYKLNKEGYNDLAPLVQHAYDVTRQLMKRSGKRLQHSIPYIVGRFQEPLHLVRFLDFCAHDSATLESALTEHFNEQRIHRSNVLSYIKILKEEGIIKTGKTRARIRREKGRQAGTTFDYLRNTVELTKLGKELYARFFLPLYEFLRLPYQFFPRSDRKEVLDGEEVIEKDRRVLYIGPSENRTRTLIELLHGSDWQIDIYDLNVEITRTSAPKTLEGYDLVVLDGFGDRNTLRSVLDKYYTLIEEHDKNGTPAILFTSNPRIADSLEMTNDGINYIFITANDGRVYIPKLREVMYKLMINPKSVRKAQFECAYSLR